ncbi:hypothetical protein FDJ28_gp20 [Pseudomonas phage Bjorn]|uniref:Uncharacterized protein n=1 Tax=Pseudomonas phage Bjorn TaxID=2079288 RepID=A0A2K9VHD1_9CAUD|nr:hypothetical protein FDJ28_gp20 [Pseudomonas phage Bjorn]AUV61766.1 hypothetical protein PsPhBjorn_gp50 [Pseudomonas phage Bjorn]
MGDVIQLKRMTIGRVDPLRICEAAQERGFEEIILIGVDKDGEPYLATSTGDAAKVLWYLENAKRVWLDQ